MTIILVIYWLIVACVWMSLLGLGALALMGFIKAFDLVREWLSRRREASVTPDRAWHEVGCIHRYGARGDYACSCPNRELDDATDYLMTIGFLANERCEQLPEDVQ